MPGLGNGMRSTTRRHKYHLCPWMPIYLLPLLPNQGRPFWMHHLQQQDKGRVSFDEILDPLPCLMERLPFFRHRFHPPVQEQCRDGCHELDLGEPLARTIKRAFGPAEKNAPRTGMLNSYSLGVDAVAAAVLLEPVAGLIHRDGFHARDSGPHIFRVGLHGAVARGDHAIGGGGMNVLSPMVNDCSLSLVRSIEGTMV